MINNFMDTLEDTFGKYKHGMSNAIRDKLKGVKQGDLFNLIKYLTEDYDMARPPSLKVIMNECYKHDISLTTGEKILGISVCEFCGQEFPQNLLRCPNCKKRRMYGITKLVHVDGNYIEPEEAPPTPEEQEDVKRRLAKVGGITGLLKIAVKREQACQMKI